MISDKIRLYKILPKVNIKTQLHIFFPFSYQQFRCYEGVFQYANQLLQIGMPCIWSKCLGIFRSQFLTLMYHLWSQATGLLFFSRNLCQSGIVFFQGGWFQTLLWIFTMKPQKMMNHPFLTCAFCYMGGETTWPTNFWTIALLAICSQNFVQTCVDCVACLLRPKGVGLGGSWWIFSWAIGFPTKKDTL